MHLHPGICSTCLGVYLDLCSDVFSCAQVCVSVFFMCSGQLKAMMTRRQAAVDGERNETLRVCSSLMTGQKLVAGG